MKFDFETQDFIHTLQEMLEDYGRMALTDGRKCYSLWLDYAPQLPEEGELLKLFLELGLGKQVVELKGQSDDQRKAWSKSAVESMMQKGESRKDAECLVNAVLETLGWSVKQAPTVPKESVITPAKEPTKNVMPKQDEMGRSTKNVISQKEEKKKATKQKDDKQVKAKKSDPVLELVKQELQVRWLHIVEAYLPKAFPQIHKVDFEHLQLPKYVMNIMEKRLGKSVIQQHKFLAYGHDEQNSILIVLTDNSLIVKTILGDDNVFVIPYQQIQQLALVGDSVIFKSTDGWKKEITMGMEGCYLVAMLRLMQGAVGDQVITREEWKTLLAHWSSMEINDRHYCTIIEKLSPKKRNNLKAWMNSVHMGYTEDQILAVMDETVFMSCKDATVITENSIYQKYWSNKYRIFYSDITHIVENADKSLSVTIHGNRKINLFHIGNKSLFNKIIQMIVFIKQHSK